MTGSQVLDILLDEAAFITARAAETGEPTLALEAVYKLRMAQAARRAVRAWASMREHARPDAAPTVNAVLTQLVEYQAIWTNDAIDLATASLTVGEGEAA